jgi:hypothetical protein
MEIVERDWLDLKGFIDENKIHLHGNLHGPKRRNRLLTGPLVNKEKISSNPMPLPPMLWNHLNHITTTYMNHTKPELR